MALITISGFPASGKSRRAKELQDSLESRLTAPGYDGPKLKVSIISDDSLSIARNAYDGNRSEKPARGAAFTALTRDLGRGTIIIMDGMNYIKGYRYQMHCVAREAQVRACTLLVAATPDDCRAWNARKPAEEQYAPGTLDNLIMRFEEPNSMARWDSPLFTVSPEDALPTEAIWATIMTGAKAPTNVAVLQNAKPPVDALQMLETTSAAIVNLIASSPSISSGSGGTIPIVLSASSPRREITLPSRSLSVAELQRHKRQFISAHKKAISQGTKGSVDWSEDSISENFIEYLESHLNV